MIVTTLALALIAGQAEPSATPVASPFEPSPAPVTETPAPQPSASPSPSPTVTATPVVPPLPHGATATTAPESYGYRFVPAQPAHPAPGVPQIFAVYLNSKKLASHGPILIKVTTDPGTVKVTSSSSGRVGTIPMIVPGDFEANSTLPKLPFIAAGMTIELEFTAVSADGRKTTVHVPVGLK